VASVGESDTFRFVGEVGDAVSITAQETGGGIGACWELYDPVGISLGGVCGQAERTLAEAGNHTIRVYDDGDAETGTYDLHMVFVSDATGSCAEAVSCGQPLPRGIGTVGESDTFQFTVASGEALTITTQETAGFVNACWELYDPDGVSLGGSCGQAEKTAAIPGTYTIRVYDNGDIETGTYDLSMSVVSDTASSCAEAIGCGQTLPRDLGVVGESDTFRFAAQAGEALSLTTQETGGFVSACWELYDPAGVSLGQTCGQAEKTAAVAGGYTIRVAVITQGIGSQHPLVQVGQSIRRIQRRRRAAGVAQTDTGARHQEAVDTVACAGKGRVGPTEPVWIPGVHPGLVLGLDGDAQIAKAGIDTVTDCRLGLR
jgi:hypothetical protein